MHRASFTASTALRRRLDLRQRGQQIRHSVQLPHDDLSEIDLASYPFTWVNGNRVVYVVDDGPPMTEDEWVEKYCTPD